jgi:D-xylose transport system ATP-binding protein
MTTDSSGASGQPLLTLSKVNKSFGAVHVLRDVDFSVRSGRVTALVGDNGAGKSTLIKALAGIHAFDSGSYTFEGQEVNVTDPKHANALGIEVVYQDLALCDNLDVVHNMFLGRELKKGVALDEAEMEQRASKTLAGLSVRTRCCGTASWSSSTSRPPHSASRRPSRCSSWCAGWRTTASPSSSSRTT